MKWKRTLFGTLLLLYFAVAFEVAIMISPFAALFYSVVNPLLLGLASSPVTRWLSAFYLPHMVLPADPLLLFVRIMGSVFFVLGMVTFIGCAIQIYAAKFLGKGAVLTGMYASIRHPQYLALSFAGLGLAILWPRILTVVLWLVMVVLYYLLAKDEERRMLQAHREGYEPLVRRTGMFLPKRLEGVLTPTSRRGGVFLCLALSLLVIGATFFLRGYTVRHLTSWRGEGNVAAVAVLPEDGYKMEHRMADILSAHEIRSRLQADKRYLAYFIPVNYVMQGMIADTGAEWKLFEKHRTLGMMAQWVFNPFGHLRGGPHAMHGGVTHDAMGQAPESVRRLIFVSVEGVKVASFADLFAINAVRVPQFMVDVDLPAARLLEVKDLPHGSGWGSVPTPTF